MDVLDYLESWEKIAESLVGHSEKSPRYLVLNIKELISPSQKYNFNHLTWCFHHHEERDSEKQGRVTVHHTIQFSFVKKADLTHGAKQRVVLKETLRKGREFIRLLRADNRRKGCHHFRFEGYQANQSGQLIEGTIGYLFTITLTEGFHA